MILGRYSQLERTEQALLYLTVFWGAVFPLVPVCVYLEEKLRSTSCVCHWNTGVSRSLLGCSVHSIGFKDGIDE